ncbi:MAG: hypothetical protein RIT04_129 [Candidatus Parcubacteria bacterium]|jgi:uncharacterized protein YuzE
MNIQYDTKADALYFSLRKGRVAKTVPVSRFLTIDIDTRGNTLGIEILAVSSHQGVELQKSLRKGIPVKIITTEPHTA